MLLMLQGYADENVANVRVISCPDNIVQELRALRLDHLVNIESR